MKPTKLAAFLYAIAVSTAALAAGPDAELEAGSPGAEVTVGNGAPAPHLRVAAGKALGLKVSGPATVRFDIRVEGGAPARAIAASIEVDGKAASRAGVKPAADASAKSNRGLAVTRAVPLEATVATGVHTVALAWPADASGDALVAVSGVRIVPAGSLAKTSLTPPGADVPRPGAAAALPLAGDPASLPLPGASLPLPGAAGPPPSADAARAEKKPSKKEKLAAALPLPEAKKEAAALPGAAKAAPPPLPAAPPKAAANAAPLPNAPANKPPAVPASDTRITTRTILAKSDKPGGSSALPGAGPSKPGSSVAPTGELSLRPTEHSLWNIRALIGAERSTEQAYTDPVSHSHLAVEGTRAFGGSWLARAELDWRTSRQQYVLDHVSPGAASRGVMTDESRVDAIANVGYDFGPRLVQSGRLELTPMLGVQYLAIRNDAFPQDLIGPNLGARSRFALSSAVVLQATLGYTYNLNVAPSSSEHSALKAPVGDLALRAGLALPLSGGYALELDYSGDVLAFQNTYRVAHGAALGFGTSF